MITRTAMVLARTIPTTFWVTSLRTNKSALFEFTIWWLELFFQHCQCFDFSKCIPGANVTSVSLNMFVPAGTTSNACNTYEGSSARSNFPSQNHRKFKAVWLWDFFTNKLSLILFLSLSFWKPLSGGWDSRREACPAGLCGCTNVLKTRRGSSGWTIPDLDLHW